MEITCREAALRWGISPRRVQLLCVQGRIAGARRAGRMWLIPADAHKPLDARRFNAASACPYWAEILQLNSERMRFSCIEEMIRQPMEEARKQLMLGEIAYLKGDYATTKKQLRHISPDSPAYLCAISIASAADAAMGDGNALVSAHNALRSLYRAYQSSGETRALIEMTEGLLYVSAFSVAKMAPWLLSGIPDSLPPSALPMVFLYAQGRFCRSEKWNRLSE